MTLSIVHFGVDNCNRVPVLENAGYRVHGCRQISELDARLRALPQPDAVLIGSIEKSVFISALKIIRSRPSPLPVVVFEGAEASGCERLKLDLIVPPLTPPDEWLKQVAYLIEKSGAVIAGAKLLREQTATLRSESAAVTAKSICEGNRPREIAKLTANLSVRSKEQNPEK